MTEQSPLSAANIAASLAARLQRIEDLEAIRNLAAIYSMAVDDHDFERLGSLFTPDARFGPDDDSPRPESADAIKAGMIEKLAGAGPSYHVNHDHLVEFEGADQARGVVQCHAETSHIGGHKIAAIRYYDTYQRLDGQWKFKERRLRFLYFVAAQDYPGVLLRRAG